MTDDNSHHRSILLKANETITPAVLKPSGKMTIPYGETSFTELRESYKKLIKELGEENEAFLLEGMSLLSDLRGALLECKKKHKPVYAVIPIDDELLTPNDLPADAAMIVMQSMGADGFGVESGDEEALCGALARLKPFSCVPLIIKPSGGSLTDGAIKELLSLGADIFADVSEECAERIAKIRGGGLFEPKEPETTDTLLLANERAAFFLEHDTTEISEPVSCSAGMGEELFDICEHSGCDVIKIQINSSEDVLDFADNAHMATLPIMLCSDNEIAMKHALMLYQGRALIDSTSLIDPDELEKAAKKYGAVIY